MHQWQTQQNHYFTFNWPLNHALINLNDIKTKITLQLV